METIKCRPPPPFFQEKYNFEQMYFVIKKCTKCVVKKCKNKILFKIL